MKNVSVFFGCKVFDHRVMREDLPAKVYQSFRKTIDEGARLYRVLAWQLTVVAAMSWGLKKYFNVGRCSNEIPANSYLGQVTVWCKTC